MTHYLNLNGNSGVLAYKISPNGIIVQFREGADTFYKYTNISAGAHTVLHMSALATQGRGLNSYISTNKPRYAAKGAALMSVE